MEMDEMTFIGEGYNYTGLDFGYDSHCDVVALDLVCDGKGYPYPHCDTYCFHSKLLSLSM
jgi:hypothetical protein